MIKHNDTKNILCNCANIYYIIDYLTYAPGSIWIFARHLAASAIKRTTQIMQRKKSLIQIRHIWYCVHKSKSLKSINTCWERKTSLRSMHNDEQYSHFSPYILEIYLKRTETRRDGCWECSNHESTLSCWNSWSLLSFHY